MFSGKCPPVPAGRPGRLPTLRASQSTCHPHVCILFVRAMGAIGVRSARETRPCPQGPPGAGVGRGVEGRCGGLGHGRELVVGMEVERGLCRGSHAAGMGLLVPMSSGHLAHVPALPVRRSPARRVPHVPARQRSVESLLVARVEMQPLGAWGLRAVRGSVCGWHVISDGLCDL